MIYGLTSADEDLHLGGGSEIRTRGILTDTHALQACAFDRSATPPRFKNLSIQTEFLGDSSKLIFL